MVLVIGGTHHNTLSMIRCLGMEGISPCVILTDEHGDKSFVLHSKYIKDYHIVKDDNEALSFLRGNYGQGKDKDIVIASSDGIASLMDLNYSELSKRFEFFNAGTDGRITKYMDKQVQVKLAKEIGFATPESYVYTVGDDIPAITEHPCITKPLESIHGGKKFNICRDREELCKVIMTYDDGDRIQIQQFIKKDYEIVVDGLSLDGYVVIPGYIFKYREHSGGTTFSSTHPVSELPPHVIDSVRQIILEIGYSGLFGVELMVCGKDYYFVEINLRNDATTYSLAVAGVNLPAMYINAIVSKTKLPATIPTIKELNCMVEMRDITFPLKRQMSLLKWWKDYRKCECKFYYTKEDPKPYNVAKREFIKTNLRKIFGRFTKRT